MKAKILEIRDQDADGVTIVAKVYWRGLPRPNYEAHETDKQYEERVKPIAEELDSYNNLHVGWVNLSQSIDLTIIPKVDEYDT